MRHHLRARLLALSPRAFELFVGELLVFVGLRDVAVTRYAGDGGLDATGTIVAGDNLIDIPTGVQVKRRRANIGRPDIDRFVGVLTNRFPHGIFITTGGYAPQAARRAAEAIPRVTSLGGEQVAELMLRHGLGISEGGGLDEGYFAGFEGLVGAETGRLAERGEVYHVAGEAEAASEAPGAERAARPEEDLISLRGLSHALRLDTKTLARRIDTGLMAPDRAGGGRLFFRRDRVEAIRAALLASGGPADPAEWRQEFLRFARSKNLTRSYKPVLLRALVALVDADGAAELDALAAAFRAFYLARRAAGLPVELAPPDPDTLGEEALRRLIVRHPLERFVIKGYLEHLPAEGAVRFAAPLWDELRAKDLLDLRRAADEQLAYYYSR